MIGVVYMLVGTVVSYRAGRASAATRDPTSLYLLGVLFLTGILLAPLLPLLVTCTGAGLLGWSRRQAGTSRIVAAVAGAAMLLLAWVPLLLLMIAGG